MVWPIWIEPLAQGTLEGDHLPNGKIEHIADGFIRTGIEQNIGVVFSYGQKASPHGLRLREDGLFVTSVD